MRVEAARHEATTAEQQVDDLASKIEEAERTVTRLRARIPSEQRVADLRRELADAKTQVAQAQGALAEYDVLLKTKDDLERWAALKDELAPLRQQVFALEQTLPKSAEEARSLEQQIGEQAGKIITLGDDLIGRLDVAVADQLRAVDTHVAQIEQLDNAMRASVERYAEADAVLASRYTALDLYRQADSAVAQALPDTSEVGQILDACQQLLAQADEALRKAIEANARALTPLMPAQQGSRQ